MNSALFSTPGDDIDPAILADVARVVQDLLRMQDLQQQPQQSFVDETSNHSRKVMPPSDYIVPLLNINDPKADTLDDLTVCEITDHSILLLSSSTANTNTSSLPSSLEPSSTHSPSSSTSTPPHPISASSGSQPDLKASALSCPVPSSNTAVATENQDNGSKPVQITPEPESAPPVVAVTAVPVNGPSPIISVVATDPPKSPTVSNATTKDQEEIKSAAQPTFNAVVPRPMPAPPTRAVRKKALLIGINYFGDPNQLLGCINDTRELFGFISGYFGFMYHDTIMLTDDSIYEDKRPTGANIRYWMKWLVKDAQPQDSLFFHYAGHGGRIKDFSYNGSSEH
ncbi:Ca(2+)-dependent cysteine protease, partial [Mortierella sp. NVP85]